MGGHLEQEAKLEVGAGFALPRLDDVAGVAGVDARPGLRLHAVYVDTEDLRLLRHGVTLRHRREPGQGGRRRGVWTLKLPSPADGKGLVRVERTWSASARAVPPAAAALVTAYARGAPLAPVARLISDRRRTVLSGAGGTALVEVDDDTVSVLDGRRIAARFREIEVELVDPAGGAVWEGVVERLRAAGAQLSDGRAKVARAVGSPPRAPSGSAGEELTTAATVRQVVAASISAGYRRLVDHDAGVRLDEDAEDVHQARVGTRRLRSDLRTFSPFLDPVWNEVTRAELGWLAGALGAVRDADVLGDRLAARGAELWEGDRRELEPVLRRLGRQREEARRELLHALTSPRYLRLLERLLQAADSPPLATVVEETNGESPSAEGSTTAAEVAAAGDGASGDSQPESAGTATGVVGKPTDVGELAAAEALLPLVRKPYRRLRREVEDAGADPDDDTLHQIRIRAKRMRYACEAVAPVAGPEAQRTAKQAADLQTVLGDHHDSVVAEAWLREAAEQARTRTAAFVIGQLVGFERRDQRGLRDEWPARWEKLRKRRNRRWMDR